MKISAIDLVCAAEILDPSRIAPEKQQSCSLILAVTGCLESHVRLGLPQYIHVDDDSTLCPK
jgi:hypothetical protein